MPFIPWIEEKDAQGEVADGYQVYYQARPDRTKVADIIKCFSHRPDFMKQVMDFSWTLHFKDGNISEKTKELLATLVSGQNQCAYCMHSHSYFLSEKGAEDAVVSALGRGDIEAAPIPEKEKQLLRFAKKMTNESYRLTSADSENLRKVGWTDPEIAEAVYIVAMFAFFNRVANAFGLEDPRYFELNKRPDPLAGFLTTER